MRRLAEDAAERSEVETSVVSGVDDEDAAAEDEAVVEGGGGGTPSPVTRADLECVKQLRQPSTPHISKMLSRKLTMKNNKQNKTSIKVKQPTHAKTNMKKEHKERPKRRKSFKLQQRTTVEDFECRHYLGLR